ncbi:MAG: UDP-3-O-(3-hydroxymyristoyl)glucosamine N-acyltransferase [Verrucomicrobiae bacterium]|nr:UDP-3-O-(3-hydroxymyristoyl)glucosamine N-acyltransferase [Verrucomicrobiae bacterium]
MQFKASEIARFLDGEVIGNSDITLSGFSSADAAKPGDLTFAEKEKFFKLAEQSGASAILVDQNFQSEKKTLIKVKNVRVAFAKMLSLFYPEKKPAPGIHPTVVVSKSANIAPTAYIGPHCVIGENVCIGENSVIHGLVYIGDNSILGNDVCIFPNVSIYHNCKIGNRVRIHSGTVIGSDGFGYVQENGRHLKVLQIGNVVIEDDVELGSNVTVDRGALGSTIIRKGTKVDNLVQIAHNVEIGEHCILVAQVGIAGSTKLGNYVTLAGQVGVAGHLTIGDGAILAAKSGLMHNVPPGEKWMGIPAQPDNQMKRIFISMQRLPDLLKRVDELEKKLVELQNANKKE